MRFACALVFVLAACGGKEDPGPSCAALTDHLLSITTGMLPGPSGSAQVPRDLMIQRCEEKHYTPQVRTCMLAAATIVAAGACSSEKPIRQPHGPREIVIPAAGSGSGA